MGPYSSKNLRLLFVAYEPWETLLGASFLELVAEQFPESVGRLMVADPFQVRSRKSAGRLRSLRSISQHQPIVIFDELSRWDDEVRSARGGAHEKFARDSEALMGPVSLEFLAKTDLHLYPRERRPYYFPLSKNQKLFATALVTEKVVRTFSDFAPSLVVMVGEQYLVKNIVGQLCSSAGTEIRVVRSARYQDFVKVDNFFLASGGTGLSTKTDSLATSRKLSTNAEENLYPGSYAETYSASLASHRSSRHRSTARVIVDAVRFQLNRRWQRFSRPPEMSRVRVWVSDPNRVRLFHALKALRTLRYIWTAHYLRQEAPAAYILIPLHYRPESSTLTQGHGLEDEDVIWEVARALRKHSSEVSCAVLEHPAMVEDRPMAFYKAFADMANVVFMDPVVSTSELIRGALGLITVSGTAALEASLAGVPVHVAGRPDFLEAIRSSGPENIESFVQSCLAGTADVSRDSVQAYLLQVRKTGHRGKFGWASMASKEQLSADARRLFRMIFPT